MGTNAMIPPMSYLDAHNKTFVGLEPDLAREVAKRLNLTIEMISAPFNPLIVSLQARRFDFVMATLADIPARRMIVDAVTYLDGRDLLVVQGGNPKNIKSVDDLCGSDVGALSGSEGEREFQHLSARCTGEVHAAINIASFKEPGMVDLQLLSGWLAATIQSAPRASIL